MKPARGQEYGGDDNECEENGCKDIAEMLGRFRSDCGNC